MGRMSSNDLTALVFIPGKNWKLSLAELISFLEVKCTKVEVKEYSRSFFVVSVSDPDVMDISALGGMIKIGEPISKLDTQLVREAFLNGDKQRRTQVKKEISETGLVERMFERESNGKPVFGVSVYLADSALRPVSKMLQRFLGSTLKKLLAARGKKVNFMGFARERNYPQLTHVEVLKKKLIENNAEILFCVGKENMLVASTTAVHNPFEFQKRDIGKPVQRTIFAMPPRLARIMINTAALQEGQVLLDPFCGVGTILQEALLSGAKVVGMDINQWCVDAATRNLGWLKEEYSLKNVNYRVVQGDVFKLTEKIGREQIDCIVTEPDLGPALRQVPTGPYAQRIMEKLQPLYHSFLEESFEVLREGARLVLVSPHIKTRSGQQVSMRIGKKATEIGFKTVFPFKRSIFADDTVANEELIEMASFVDSDERHKIGREISIFQK
jgi:tRNA G10  N-methylase Trm11